MNDREIWRSIGNGEVQAVFVQVVPETSGNDVPQRIREVVRHHFGFAGQIKEVNTMLTKKEFSVPKTTKVNCWGKH